MQTAGPPSSVFERTDSVPAALDAPVDGAVAGANDHSSGTRRTRVRIQPDSGWPRVDLREIWSYRGLFFFLAWKDVKVRYAQTVMGAGWAILQPVLTMVMFTVIFGGFVRVPSDGVPYAVFSLAALIPWTYFSQAFSGASNSLIANTNLLTKVYFPRLLIPYGAVVAALVDFAIGLGLLLVVVLAYGIVPGWHAIVTVPVLLIVAMMTAGGAGCWLAALNVQYRDVKHLTPFIIQLWLYASPIVYPLSVVPARYRPLYALNPLASVVEGFRSAFLGTHTLDASLLAVSAAVALGLFISGALYFRHTERIFADVV